MKREFGFQQPTGKSKMWIGDEQQNNQPLQLIKPVQPDAGADELMAVLGYKVRSSDMAEVAQKLEQLERALGDDGSELLSQLSSETVHVNPSDLSSWVQSMLSEITPNSDSGLSSDLSFQTNSLDDLSAIPGGAICAPDKKRIKSSPPPQELARSVVLPEDSGVRLVHALLACAEAIQQNQLQLAESLVNQIGLLAVSQAGSMRKVATYFGEALARRIYRNHPREYSFDSFDSSSLSELLELHFYESCPYLKFSHFTANQAILEALQGYDHVHVIDFSMKQGLQWPALIQALALRPGGPPTFRLTAIGPPQPDNTDTLQQVGWRLAQLAESVNIKFQYRGFVANTPSDITADMLNLRDDEAVAVNSVFELHRLLAKPASFEKVMCSIRAMKPKIVTIVEQEANHNGPAFLDRFTESLYYYSSMFDSLEGCGGSKEDQVMSEVYLGKQIYNVVACEGAERVERHETLSQWRVRLGSVGLVPVGLGSNAFKQASMLLSLFGGSGVDGYSVVESDGCLMLGWHTRPLIATSAWKLGALNEFS